MRARKKLYGRVSRAQEGEDMSAAIALQKKIEKLNQKEIIKKINLKMYQNPKKRKKPFDADTFVKE